METESRETNITIIKARDEDLRVIRARLKPTGAIALRKCVKRDKKRTGIRLMGTFMIEGWEGPLCCCLGGQELGQWGGVLNL